MTSLSDLKFSDVEQSLTVRRIRIMQIVYGALVFSVMSLLVLFLFFYAMSTDLLMRGVQLTSQVQALTIVLWGVVVVGLIGGTIIFRMRIGPKQLAFYAARPMGESGDPATGPAEKLLMLVQQAVIGRAVLFTVPAVTSAVICLYWVLAGAFLGYPERLVHVVPAFLQIAFLASTWPTSEWVLGIARRSLSGD